MFWLLLWILFLFIWEKSVWLLATQLVFSFCDLSAFSPALCSSSTWSTRLSYNCTGVPKSIQLETRMGTIPSHKYTHNQKAGIFIPENIPGHGIKTILIELILNLIIFPLFLFWSIHICFYKVSIKLKINFYYPNFCTWLLNFHYRKIQYSF